MRFTSYEFLFLFLPFVLLGYYILRRFKSSQPGKIFLSLMSMLFYASFGALSAIVLILSLVVNYATGYLTHRLRHRGKLLFIAGLLYNLGSYGLMLFLIAINQQVSDWFHTSFFSIPYAVPFGLGVITLHQIFFLINVCLKGAVVPAFTEYSLYITFFPQLPAGPVSSYKTMIQQYEDDKIKNISSESLADGLYIFAIGIFKKAVLAESLSVYVKNGYGIEQIGFLPAWLTALSFTFQIYFEFSGICDMAVGLSKMFQFSLPFSFLSPYRAKGLRGFWHSWNNTVIQNLEEVIITSNNTKKHGILTESMGIFVILILGSFWYGFTPGILLWGLLQGLFTALEVMYQPVTQKIPKIVTGISTFLLINLLWVLFRAETLLKAGSIYKGMLSFWRPGFEQIGIFVREGTLYFPVIVNMGYFLAIFLLSAMLCFFGKNTFTLAKKNTYSISSAVLTGFLLLLAVICTTRLV